METDKISVKQLIHTYVSNAIKSESVDGITPAELLQLQEITEQGIYDSIRKEILQDLTEAEKEQKTKQLKRALDKEKIKQLTSLLWEGGLLAFFIGLLVNQVSNFLTAKVCPQGYSWIIILLLLVSIIGVFCILLYRSISHLFNLGE